MNKKEDKEIQPTFHTFYKHLDLKVSGQCLGEKQKELFLGEHEIK